MLELGRMKRKVLLELCVSGVYEGERSLGWEIELSGYVI